MTASTGEDTSLASVAAETLLAALRGETPSSQSPAVLAEVVARAEAHGVLEVIAEPLLGSDGLAEKDRDAIARARLLTLARHLHLVSRLRSLSGALDAAGVPWAVFKGPVLAVEAYGDPSLRRYGDIDILVAGGHFGAAVDSLTEAGARLLDTNWAYQLRAARAEASLLMPGQVHVDLHWHLCNEREARRDTDLPIEAMLARRRRLTVASDVDLPVLDSADTFLATALHAAVNGAYRLLWSKDLERLAAGATEEEWGQLVRRCRHGRVAVPVALVLLRSRRLLGAAVPEEVLRALLAGHPWAELLRRREAAVGPAAIVYQHGSGRATISVSRDRLWATARAAHAEIHRRSQGNGANGEKNPLYASSEDARARNEYLAAVAEKRV